MVERRNFKQNPITPDEQVRCYWYVVENDLIGGWSISNVNKPESQQDPYEGEFEIATFVIKEVAEHMAEVHNTWWEIEVWKTYSANIYATYSREINEKVSSFKDYMQKAIKNLPRDPESFQARFDRGRMKD